MYLPLEWRVMFECENCKEHFNADEMNQTGVGDICDECFGDLLAEGVIDDWGDPSPY